MQKERNFNFLKIFLVLILFLFMSLAIKYYFPLDSQIKQSPPLDPTIYGHDATELNVEIPGEGTMTLQEAIETNRLGSNQVVSTEVPQFTHYAVYTYNDAEDTLGNEFSSSNGRYKWQVPEKTTRILVSIIGGGAGGSYATSAGCTFSGESGGSSVGGQKILHVKEGEIIDFQVGAGGAISSNGGDSAFLELTSTGGTADGKPGAFNQPQIITSPICFGQGCEGMSILNLDSQPAGGGGSGGYWNMFTNNAGRQYCTTYNQPSPGSTGKITIFW